MKPLNDIFNGMSFFRIPIYQRGYSWERPQLEAFWNDIDNLTNNKHNHYMGMIGVEKLNENLEKQNFLHWDNYHESLSSNTYSFYHIVDGQQRLTTIIILISQIRKYIDESDFNWSEYLSKKDISRKYISIKPNPNSSPFYIFGYEADKLSHTCLVESIFNNSPFGEETNKYTGNLLDAENYFRDKIEKIKDKSGDFQKQLRVLFDILTIRLQFDFNPFSSAEISMIFETMNDRGKPLSNLEKLKNRLIYLTTLFKKENMQLGMTPDLLVSKIGNTWATIFKYLGKFENYKSEEDDTFLKNHWIMYSRFDKKEAEFYRKDIFDREFTVKKVLSGDLGVDELNDYVECLEKSIPIWYSIYNPRKHDLDCNNEKILILLNKLNYIGFKAFAPIILNAFYQNESEEKITELLSNIEKHIFLLFYFSFRKADIGTYNFYAKASAYFKKEKNLDYIIDDIYKNWTYGSYEVSKPSSSYIEPNNFLSVMKDYFVMNKRYGFYSWSGRVGIKYLLMEYELSINPNLNPASIQYDKYFIELIFPGAIEINGDEDVEENSEKEQIITLEDVKEIDTLYLEYLKDKKNSINKEDAILRLKKLKYTLGNLVLVKKNYSTEQRRMNFEEKKSNLNWNDMLANEKEAFSYPSWKPIDILKRGIDLLTFMENRWNFSFDDWKLDKRKVLFLDFIDPNQ